MGVYLNSRKPHTIYKRLAGSEYFVDKTDLLRELISVLGRKDEENMDSRYLCITRPRRFGKTAAASMIAAFFGKGADSREVFSGLRIHEDAGFESHLNRHNVIYIPFNEAPDNCSSYQAYIARIRERLLEDLRRAWPDAGISGTEAVWDALNLIYETQQLGEGGDAGNAEFIFVLDEWDYLYHQDYASRADQEAFTKFLSTLLKDQPYVELAYMTGILPIAKYSSGSELNMFLEYSMATQERFSLYFGFTEEEVRRLFEKYLLRCGRNAVVPGVTLDGLEKWYDGYHTMGGRSLYNPRSVISALANNQLGSYWTSAGPYDEIYSYVKNDIAEISGDIAKMMCGTPVPALVQEYASTSMELATKEQIFSAMVVYGFLTYGGGFVSIPNKELMDQFAAMVREKADFGYLHRMARESQKMLDATLAGDTETMVRILERVHNSESPLIRYSDEAELSKVITFVYLQARQYYEVRQEDRSGTGFVDFAFYPYRKKDDGIILELKVDATAEHAIAQIKKKNYIAGFEGYLGDRPKCTGRILAVGIAYSRKDAQKRHTCRIEVLRERL